MPGAFLWFGINLYRNLQYVEGHCVVLHLPDRFETTGKIDEVVKARYIVERFFVASPQRHAGKIVQECHAAVPCSKMDYGATNSYDDDRCVVFQSWKLGDDIPCYYRSSDFWGDKGTQLSCLSLPSKMERETFTVAISVVINMLICFVVGIFKWHQNDLRKQAEIAAQELANAEAMEAEAKRMIEEQEKEETLRQAEEERRELGITDGDEDGAMQDVANYVA